MKVGVRNRTGFTLVNETSVQLSGTVYRPPTVRGRPATVP